jgi:cytochrome c oxidase cbb3-type subunit 3
MSSRFRSDVVSGALVAILGILSILAGCERERREYHSSPTSTAQPHPRLSTLQPGEPLASPADPVGAHYENNAYHITQGGRLFRWFNCNGCHANGGGAIGPALMDAQWRYGGRIDQIHASILEGRPNGMPSWRGKMTDQQAWQLSAYIRALSGNVRKDAAPSRREGMQATPPPTRIPSQPPRAGDDSAQTVPSP